MGYSYTTINGQRVEVNVAAAFRNMAAAFKAATGCDLLVTSGTRTRAEQQYLYDGWIARKPGFNLAAKPGQSNHEESGPRGPRALDLRDSGNDAGVTRIGSARSNWLVANAPRFGFTNAGHYFNPREGWHYEFTGAIGGGAPTTPAAPTSSGAVAGVHGPNPFGIAFTGGLQKIARLYGYKGALDQHWGGSTPQTAARSGSMAGFVEFLRRNWGYSGNTVLGPVMWKAIQRWLKARWGYTGAIDGIPGAGTRSALLRADTANWNEL
ncbi:endolysin [Microbacterium phage Gretchen]|nr:endolysin [Microbacterium phage Gretchen]